MALDSEREKSPSTSTGTREVRDCAAKAGSACAARCSATSRVSKGRRFSRRATKTDTT